MSRKLLLLLVLLSATVMAHTPTRRHRVLVAEPDAPLLAGAPAKALGDFLMLLSPTERSLALGEISMRVTDLLAAARAKLGSRYRVGSTGPTAFDCSGFTSYVFRQLGVSLARSSQEQSREGTLMSDPTQLRPGDLVFFGRSGRKSRTVNHVGIVTDTDPERGTFSFIHSSTSQGVITSSSTDAYWSRRFVGGRRVLTD